MKWTLKIEKYKIINLPLGQQENKTISEAVRIRQKTTTLTGKSTRSSKISRTN